MDELDRKMESVHYLRSMFIRYHKLTGREEAALLDGIDALKKEIERLKEALAKEPKC